MRCNTLYIRGKKEIKIFLKSSIFYRNREGYFLYWHQHEVRTKDNSFIIIVAVTVAVVIITYDGCDFVILW